MCASQRSTSGLMLCPSLFGDTGPVAEAARLGLARTPGLPPAPRRHSWDRGLRCHSDFVMLNSAMGNNCPCF